MIGLIKLPLTSKKFYVVSGGPYRQRPQGYTGVKMAMEIEAICAVDIPTRDYSVPSRDLLDAGLSKAVALMTAGHPLYVGCMGGVGRTGLFLAVLAKAFGVEDPIQFVRKHYSNHAVETAEQEKYLAAYVIPADVAKAIKKAQRFAFLYFWRSNLTDMPDAPIAAPPTSYRAWSGE